MSKESKYNTSSTGRTYGYDKKGGWDIDTSDRTQKTSDGGHIPGRYQWEETVDVSLEDEKDKQIIKSEQFRCQVNVSLGNPV